MHVLLKPLTFVRLARNRLPSLITASYGIIDSVIGKR